VIIQVSLDHLEVAVQSVFGDDAGGPLVKRTVGRVNRRSGPVRSLHAGHRDLPLNMQITVHRGLTARMLLASPFGNDFDVRQFRSPRKSPRPTLGRTYFASSAARGADRDRALI
jgi:hypothetical protein